MRGDDLAVEKVWPQLGVLLEVAVGEWLHARGGCDSVDGHAAYAVVLGLHVGRPTSEVSRSPRGGSGALERFHGSSPGHRWSSNLIATSMITTRSVKTRSTVKPAGIAVGSVDAIARCESRLRLVRTQPEGWVRSGLVA